MRKHKFSSRFGTPDDGERIFEVLVKAFEVPQESAKWLDWRRMALRDAEYFRVLEIKGEIIAVLKIDPMRIRVGSCEIIQGHPIKGAVLPKFQDKGYYFYLLRDMVQWMRDSDYDSSRVWAATALCNRFGYVPFPIRYFEFPVEPLHIGAKNTSKRISGEIRLYDASRDTIRKNEVYQIFNSGRTGSIVRDFDPNIKMPETPSAPNPLRIVYEVDGVIEGYLFADDNGRSIHEIAFNPSFPDALVELVKKILFIAAINEIKSVTSFLPFDATTFPILVQSGIAFRLHEFQGGHASNMIQILNLELLLRRIAPELESRLRTSIVADACCEVEIRIEGQRVGLRLDSGKITVGVPVSNEAAFMQTDQATMMKLIYGMLSFDEALILGRESIDPITAAILRTWFSRQQTGNGALGGL